MAGDGLPSVHKLDKPERLQDILKQERDDDCLPCKVVGKFCVGPFPTRPEMLNSGPGSGAFLGLAAYSYFSGMSQLEKQRAQILQSKSMFGLRSRRMGIAGISLGLTWLGIWRWMR